MKKTPTLNSGKRFIIITVVSALTSFGLMLYLTALCGYITDDWHFMFVWHNFVGKAGEKRISSLADIILSMKQYYNLSGGRVLCHFVTYCMLTMPKWAFNLLNAGMFTELGLSFCKLVSLKTKITSPYLLPACYLFLFSFLPAFGDCTLWVSGSCNYLWPAVLMLLCVYLTDKYEGGMNLKKSLIISVAVLFFGAMGEITGGMIVLYLIYKLICNRKQAKYYLLPIASAIPGMLFVILAPGNFNRLEKVGNAGSVVRTVLYYFKHLLLNYWCVFLPAVIVLMLLIMRKTTFKKAVSDVSLYIVGIAGCVALGLSRNGLQRAAFMPYLLIMLNGFIISVRLLKTESNEKKALFASSGFLCCMAYILLYKSKTLSVIFISVIIISTVIAYIPLSAKNKALSLPRGFAKIINGCTLAAMAVALVLSVSYYTKQMNAYNKWQDNVLTAVEMKSEMPYPEFTDMHKNDFLGRMYPHECIVAQKYPYKYSVSWMKNLF